METQPGKAEAFPHYLPKPDDLVLKWVGNYLKASRNKKTSADIAAAAGVETKVIDAIEDGIIHQDLGFFRHILQRGYHQKLEEVISKCYEQFSDKFNPKEKRLFERDYYYSICLKNEGKKPPTTFFVAGNPESYLWAVPFRKLKNQPLSVDLLELAPAKIRKQLGQTEENSHDGVEVIHVINGTVSVSIDTKSEGSPERKLKAGDSIHFNSTCDHQIGNENNTTSALLLIVRCAAPV